MWVCLAIPLVWTMNFSISADARASASASAAPASTSSVSRPSSAVLASSRCLCDRATRASEAFRSAACTAPAASSWEMMRILPASSAAARTIWACWLARSVRSPVVLATSSVEAVICWVEAAICCAIAAASEEAFWMARVRSRSDATMPATLDSSWLLPYRADPLPSNPPVERSPCATRAATRSAVERGSMICRRIQLTTASSTRAQSRRKNSDTEGIAARMASPAAGVARPATSQRMPASPAVRARTASAPAPWTARVRFR